jgi:nitrite reductase/ring-hydroxylating ferredoxin subunit
MAGADGWTDVGAAAELAATPLQRIAVGNSEIALSFRDGSFGAVANACNHAGGPLGEGCLDSDYIVCPWHHWKFHRVSGVGEPGSEEDRVPSFPVKVEHGRVLVNLRAATRRTKRPHPPHPLARLVARAPGPLRLAGISTPSWTLPIRASRVPTTSASMARYRSTSFWPNAVNVAPWAPPGWVSITQDRKSSCSYRRPGARRADTKCRACGGPARSTRPSRSPQGGRFCPVPARGRGPGQHAMSALAFP